MWSQYQRLLASTGSCPRQACPSGGQPTCACACCSFRWCSRQTAAASSGSCCAAPAGPQVSGLGVSKLQSVPPIAAAKAQAGQFSYPRPFCSAGSSPDRRATSAAASSPASCALSACRRCRSASARCSSSSYRLNKGASGDCCSHARHLQAAQEARVECQQVPAGSGRWAAQQREIASRGSASGREAGLPGSGHQQLAVLGEQARLQRQLPLLRLLLLELQVLPQRGVMPPLQLQGCKGPGGGGSTSEHCKTPAATP